MSRQIQMRALLNSHNLRVLAKLFNRRHKYMYVLLSIQILYLFRQVSLPLIIGNIFNVRPMIHSRDSSKLSRLVYTIQICIPWLTIGGIFFLFANFVTSLPDEEFFFFLIISVLSNFKAFADDKLTVIRNIELVFQRVERKGENSGYQHLLLFLQCFQNAFFFKSTCSKS